MAALTWREVSAPNFGGSNAALAAGAQLQSNAFAGLGEAIQKAQLQQQAQAQATADSAVLARALQVNDAGAYQKALTDGTFLSGVNPAAVSPETLNALGSRATTLLGQANTRQNMGESAYKQNRTETLDQIQDAARGATARAYGITDARLADLPPEQQLAVAAGRQNLVKGEQALRQGEVNIVGSNLNNANRSFQNRIQERDDLANEAGINASTNIMRGSFDSNDALAQLEQMNNLSPREYANAAARLAQTYGNLYAPQASAPGAGSGKGPATPGTQAGSPYDATFNFQGTNQPISAMPIKDVLAVQQNSINTQGHSPMGAFQINKATLEGLAPKVLGENWRDQEFTPEVQEKLAKALFDDRKGGDLTKTWAALPNSSPGAYKNFSWEDMRAIIANGEVGQNLPSDKASLGLLTQMSQQEYKRRQSQNNSVGVTADVEKNYSDTRPAGEVVKNLIETQFPTADPAKLVGLVNRIQRDNPGLSAADVGSIVSRSVRDSAWYTSGTTTFGDGIGVDDDALERNTQDYIRGQADRSSLANTLTRDEAAKLDNAQKAYDTAYQNLMQINQRQRIQPGINTTRAQAALDRAEAQLKKALSKQRQDPNSRPTR